MQVLNEVTFEFPDTKAFIQEYLEKNCLEENMSVEEVIYLFIDKFRSKELAQKTFFIV